MYMILFAAMINHLTISIIFVAVMSGTRADKFIPFPTLPTADTFVSTEKGFVLQHVGTYSRILDKGILHTFVPILDLYKASLNADLGLGPSKLIDRNMLQLSNIMSSSNAIFAAFKYDKIDIFKFSHQRYTRHPRYTSAWATY